MRKSRAQNQLEQLRITAQEFGCTVKVRPNRGRKRKPHPHFIITNPETGDTRLFVGSVSASDWRGEKNAASTVKQLCRQLTETHNV